MSLQSLDDALKPSVAAAVPPQTVLQTMVEVQSALLSQPHLTQAGGDFVRECARKFDAARVSLGLVRRDLIEVVALSDGLPPAKHAPLIQRLAAAMAEALDQRCVLQLPASREAAQPRITLAQQKLLQDEAGSVVNIPMVVAGEIVGLLCVQRSGAANFTGQEVAALEHLACTAAPVLRLMQLNERPWHRRLRDEAKARYEKFQEGRALTVRYALVGCGVVLAGLLLIPIDQKIGGHARLEGAVQRMLVSPSDGFLHQVHARPGDLVKAGQVLVELAEQDLRLEQMRWESQMSQHENAYVAAQAGANRAQLVINQSRAAEAEAQLELVNMKLERSHIESPFDGVVIQGDLSQQLGAPVQQGAELMTVAPRDRFRVIVEVDERDIGDVKLGQNGSLALSALPWNTLPLRVKRISPMATAMDGRNVFEVEAELLEQPGDLRPGLQGSARIVAGSGPALWNWSRRLVDAIRLGVWEWLG